MKITTLPMEQIFLLILIFQHGLFFRWGREEKGGGRLNKYVVMFRKVKEPSGYIKCGKCLDWTGNYQLFKKGSAHRT